MDSQHKTPIQVDGTTLEGGGQLLRLSLAFSSLTRAPFRITNIRGKRGPTTRPGQDGGMKQAHLVGAQWLEAVTKATTEGMELKSRELTFAPLPPNLDDALLSALPDIDSDERPPASVWKDIYSARQLIRRDSKITMSTPGSIFLVLQAILPYILFTPTLSEAGEAVPIRLTIIGGTNVWHSLSYEYADQVLFPMLRRLGFGLIKMNRRRRGWSMGSRSIGEVSFDIKPLDAQTQLPAFNFTSRGELSKIHASIVAPNPSFRAGMRQSVVNHILHYYPDIEIEFPVDEGSGHDKRAYLLLVAETTNGYRLGRDWLYDERINRDAPQKNIERLVKRVVKDLRTELAHGGCVDEYLQDQLVVFQALSAGTSCVSGGTPSLHTQTARWVAEQLVGVKFDSDGACTGVGFEAGIK